MTKSVKLVSYWTSAAPMPRAHQRIRHTSHEDAAIIASQQALPCWSPSSSVWMVPGTEQED